jgi:hypothetical protein
VNAFELFAAMVIAHVIADYPLQGDFLSRAKNRFAGVAGVPWYQALGAHSAIHAGAVWALTGSALLGLAEFVAHAITDDRKCAGRLNHDQDQAVHVACKLVWSLIAGLVL